MASAPTPATAVIDATPGPLYVDTQHEDVVHDAQLDYYGSKLASCSSDRTVKIYNVSESSYELVATLQGHEGPVWQVAWAHPKFGCLLASCAFDGSVLIHREGGGGATANNASGSNSSGSNKQRQQGGGQQQQQQQGGGSSSSTWTLLHAARQLHASSVNGVSFCPHEYGLQVASASSDGRVSVLTHLPNNYWKVDMLQDCTLGVNAVSWAPYGAYEPTDDDDGNNDEKENDTNDENNGGDGQEGGDGTDAAAALAAKASKSGGGGSGGVAPPRLVTAGCDAKIRFWVYKSSSAIDGGGNGGMDDGSSSGEWMEDTTLGIVSEGKDVPQHTDWVRDVAWAPLLVPNENTVASASEDGTVLIWKQKIPTKKKPNSGSGEGGESNESSSSSSSDTLLWKPTILHDFQEPVWRVSWSVTGNLLAVSSGDSNVTLWKAGLDGTWSQIEEK